MSGGKKDITDLLGEHKLGFMFITCLCFAIAIYCFKTAGAISFGDQCEYQFQCADLVQYELVCRPVLGVDRCVVLEEDGECPDHTRHEEGACLPIEGMRTIDRGEDRIAPSIHGPSSALGDND